MAVRGIRGATTAQENSVEAILEATEELLRVLVEQNQIDPAEIASAFFTTTRDLNAEYPAYAARRLGWLTVPLICGHEMDVPDRLPLCVRVMLHYNTDLPQSAMRHAYLRGAVVLRRDLVDRFGQSDDKAGD
ncbi:MAG TPA: chorismate mutase [Chloroflexota bacterium]|nr:chorismate mutase [Chloroflexota bacterium]